MKKLIGVVAVAAGMFGVTAATQAAPLKWTLTNATFPNGATASGSFVYDDVSNEYSHINLTTTTDTDLPGSTYQFVCNAPCDGVPPGPTGPLVLTTTSSSDLTNTPVVYINGNTLTNTAGSSQPFQLWETTCSNSTCFGPGPVSRFGTVDLVSTIYLAPQSITFTSAGPTAASVGQTYEVTATGGASGNPVEFSIDSAATAVCSITGNMVSFIAQGTCVINANQAGDTTYEAAPQVNQSFAITAAPVTPPPAAPTPVPSLSQWSLMLLASLLGGLAFWRQRRNS